MVPQAAIVELSQVDPEIGGILLEAFAARRLIEVQRGQGTLIIIGSLHARRCGTRSPTPSATASPTAGSTRTTRRNAPRFRHRGRRRGGPKVVVRGRHVLSEPSVSDVARALGLAMAVDPSKRRT